MGEDKVRESPAEVFATVAEVNSAFHSLEDMLETRFEALEEQLKASDARNQSQFQALKETVTAMEIKNEGRFDPVAQIPKSQDFNIEQCVTSTANKLMIMMLLIGGSIIASLLYGG